MKQNLFTGVCTALVTPFSDGQLDEESLAYLIGLQIASGVSAICVSGTTGEAATLSDAEWHRLVSLSGELIGDSLPLIVGVGTNSTADSCRRARFAALAGAKAVLAVTPYYNRGTEDGIVAHYHKIADAAGIPVIIYNVPSRTGVDLTVPLYLRIAAHPGIAAIKEAGGGYERLLAITEALGDRLTLYTGSDTAILTAIALGAKGVISVMSNLLPRETVEMVSVCLEGNMSEARRLQLLYMPLLRALFEETNPAPIKCAMEICGLCGGEVRLPLSPVRKELRDRLSFLLGMQD
jgi:4-hydroxy-tetrahydrodipicolinate synthase